MQHAMKRFILIIVAILSVSCSVSRPSGGQYVSGSDYYNQVYRGRTHAEIVMEWGAPDRESSDGAGGVILVYEKFTTTTKTDIDDHFGLFSPDVTTTTTDHKSYIHFFIGRDGICYNVNTNYISPEGRKGIATAFLVGSGVCTALFVGGAIAILSHRSL